MVRNFLFHRVNPIREKLWDPMDPLLFERCIRYICRNFKVVLLEDLVSNTITEKKDRLATIVFDDGFHDNLEYAAPILKKYGVCASFYVVTDCIDFNRPTWTYMLEYRFEHTKQNNLSLDFDFLPAEIRHPKLHHLHDRMAFVKKLKPLLKKLSHENRNEVLNRISSCFNDVVTPKVMMNWDEVVQLNRAGHYIGSHTLSHCMLGTMENEEEIFYELSASGNKIKEKLGYFPQTISYPVGSYNQTTITLSRKAGYVAGLAVKQEEYFPDRDNRFEIPRIELYNENWIKTSMRINHTLEKVKKITGYR